MKQIKVLLLRRVAKLGHIGDVVAVKPGFARNYLLPQKIALRANKANMEYFESKRTEIESVNAAAKEKAETLKTQMNDISVILIRQASERGHLYGSVSARDIANYISEKGFSISANQINIGHPIKEIGVYTVTIDLHAEVSIDVKVAVGKTEQEALEQMLGKPVEEEKHPAETVDSQIDNFIEEETN